MRRKTAIRQHKRWAWLSSALLAAAALCGCGGGSAASTTTITTPTVNAKYVVLVVLENANFSEVVGSADAPYLNSLIAQGSLTTNYYANVHPSIGNYFMMTTGTMASTDDAYAGQVSPPDMNSVLTSAGKSWKVYAEGIPAPGYTGGDTGAYLKHHDPFAYFSDVVGSSAANNIVPFSQLATDEAATPANFIMIAGNMYDDGHTCAPSVTTCTTAVRLQQADAWLQSTLPQVLNNAAFAASGLLAVTFDESDTDNTNGGGKVPTVLLGTNVKSGYQATGLYQHQSLLRLMLEAQGIENLPGASASASSMSEVWK
jgi:acid phosphatase